MKTTTNTELTCAWRTVIDAKGKRHLVATWVPKDEPIHHARVA